VDSLGVFGFGKVALGFSVIATDVIVGSPYCDLGVITTDVVACTFGESIRLPVTISSRCMKPLAKTRLARVVVFCVRSIDRHSRCSFL